MANCITLELPGVDERDVQMPKGNRLILLLLLRLLLLLLLLLVYELNGR